MPTSRTSTSRLTRCRNTLAGRPPRAGVRINQLWTNKALVRCRTGAFFVCGQTPISAAGMLSGKYQLPPKRGDRPLKLRNFAAKVRNIGAKLHDSGTNRRKNLTKLRKFCPKLRNFRTTPVTFSAKRAHFTRKLRTFPAKLRKDDYFCTTESVFRGLGRFSNGQIAAQDAGQEHRS